MSDLENKLLEHIDAEFSPDWPEKAAHLMEQAASYISWLRSRLSDMPSITIGFRTADDLSRWEAWNNQTFNADGSLKH